MGAIDFQTYGRGKTMQQAFTEAYQRAEYEHGHDAYNGTISTTTLEKDATEDFKRSGLSLDEYVNKKLNEEEAVDKWECWGIHVEGDRYLFFGLASC